MINQLLSMTGGAKMRVLGMNKPLSVVMYLLVIIVDLLLRGIIFKYCYNNVVVKLNRNFREIDFNESLLIVIMVSCLIGR